MFRRLFSWQKRSSKIDDQNKNEASDFSSFASIDLIYELAGIQANGQFERLDKLDDRTISLITIATAVIAAALTVQAALPSIIVIHITSFFSELFQSLALILVALAYIFTMFISFLSYSNEPLFAVPEINKLVHGYLSKEESYTKAALLNSLLKAYNRNAQVVQKKAILHSRAFSGLWIESFLVVLLVLLHTII